MVPVIRTYPEYCKIDGHIGIESQGTVVSHDFQGRGDEAKDLLSIDPDVEENKVARARLRLAEVLNKSLAVLESARTKIVDGAKATDKAIRTNPYRALGCALGAGVLVGLLLCAQR